MCQASRCRRALTMKRRGLLFLFDGADKLRCLAGPLQVRGARSPSSRPSAAPAQVAVMVFSAAQSFAS